VVEDKHENMRAEMGAKFKDKLGALVKHEEAVEGGGVQA
jgi:hypothetical protein